MNIQWRYSFCTEQAQKCVTYLATAQIQQFVILVAQDLRAIGRSERQITSRVVHILWLGSSSPRIPKRLGCAQYYINSERTFTQVHQNSRVSVFGNFSHLVQ